MPARLHLTAKRQRTPEGAILRACLDYLAVQPGCWVWRNNTGSFTGEHKGKRRFVRFGAVGSSDILGVLTVDLAADQYDGPRRVGVFLAVEVKSAKGRLTAHQEAFLEMVRARGGIALCVRSVEELRDGLEAARKAL